MTELQERSINLLNRFVLVGIVLTCIGTLLYVADDILRVGRVGGVVWAQLVIVAVNVFVLLKVRERKNWARRLCIILFVLLAVPIIPAMVASRPGGVFYSSNNLLALAQRFANLSDLLFSAVFTVLLFTPRIRALFSSTPAKTYQRVLLALCACVLFVVGLVGFWGAQKLGEYVRIEGQDVHLTKKGEAWLAPKSEEDRAAAEKLVKMGVPKWGFVDFVIDGQGFDVVTFHDFTRGQSVVLFISESDQKLSLDQMLGSLDKKVEEWLKHSPTSSLKRLYQPAKRWNDLSPTVTTTESFSTNMGSIDAQRVEFRGWEGHQEGVQIATQKGGRPVTILSYGDFFNKQAIQDFLDQFLSSVS